MTKRALIIGITGQDGSYFCELLLEKGYSVHGTVRRVAIEDPEHRMWRIRHLLDDIQLHLATLESYPSIFRAIVEAMVRADIEFARNRGVRPVWALNDEHGPR